MLSQVFVYGSLKRGFYNHRRYLSQAEFLGKAVSLDRYHMFSCGGAYPYLCSDGEHGLPVMGEVYRVTSDQFNMLDALEGYPDHYTREQRNFEVDGQTVTAWVYLINEDEYDSSGASNERVETVSFGSSKFLNWGEDQD